MKRVLALLIALVWLVALAETVVRGQAAVFLVRHAEKAQGDSKDPPLTAEGRARADRLAAMLKDVGIKAIYTSEFQRTQLTAAPLVKRLGLTPVTIPADDERRLVTHVRSHYANDVVLIVSHSNTIPSLIKAFGSNMAITIDDDDYSNLLVVVPRGDGMKAVVLRLRY